jgi:hypothetical protein
MLSAVFSTTSAITSAVIRWKTGDPCSHASVLHDAYGGLFVMEAEWRGFRLVPWKFFQERNRIVAVVSLDGLLQAMGIDPRERVNFAASWLGDEYGWAELFGQVVPALLRFSSPKALLCSEVLVRLAPELFPGVDPERSDPGMLRRQLVGSGGQVSS